ncbi:uncharacterized protein TNCV_1774551 [Trichonephila clavipes]|nr:uncharacterized protein TNCV_1774551 [Trichonephila clavipes]
MRDSEPAAISRLLAMERKFKNNSDFEKQYKEFMNEYESQGHMSLVNSNSHTSDKDLNFLPHHAVIKPSSTTTKLRVVFDASLSLAKLQMNASNDTFGFQPSLERTPPRTKRRILSESSKIFDPLGLLSPCTVFMKIFYQKLWLTKTDWDSPIPQKLTENWLKFQKAFNEINYLTVPRWVILTADNTVKLHGFADASLLAYAAAIYCRQKHNRKIKVQLLISKTKVAPVKQVSIPGLELCDAHLLSKIFKLVFRTLKHYTFDVFAWTYSKIVLSWLSSHPPKWKTFVANGTSEIMEVLPTKHWRHVPSKKILQILHPEEEIQSIKKQISLPLKSPLRSLHPFIDEHGLVRVGERLQNSQLRFNSKHPIIVPYLPRISEFLIKEQHIAHLHSGPTVLAHVLRQSHRIVGSRKIN